MSDPKIVEEVILVGEHNKEKVIKDIWKRLKEENNEGSDLHHSI